MARSKFRRSLQIENLESRQLLSSVGPATAEQQDMLYWVNLARTTISASTTPFAPHSSHGTTRLVPSSRR